MQVRNQLAEQGATDVLMVSISIDPEHDRPEQLREMRDRYSITDEPGKPRWIFCTGSEEAITAIRKSLGLWDPDPIVDQDKTQHAGTVVYGDDRLDRWAVTPALIEPRRLSEAILRRLELGPHRRK